MKLINYERPCVTRYGRLFPSFTEELEQVFDLPLNGWVPALDVHEDKEKFTVNLEAPGLKREDISVQFIDGDLVISGERKTESLADGVQVHRQETRYGKFVRTITLPTGVKVNETKAAYKDGVLTVTLPKADEAKPKQIDVSVN